MTDRGAIKIGQFKIETTRFNVQKFKAILDKLQIPHILDDVGFHNTMLDLYRMKSLYRTDVWKVEKDGSIDLKNRFGHSGRFEYRCLEVKNLLEFRFVDLSILNEEEARLLSDHIYEVESKSDFAASAG